MMRKLSILVLCIAGLAQAATTGSIVDWKVGDPGTTYQMWDFTTDANPAAPDVDNNPYGDYPAVKAKISNVGNPDFYWRDGVWRGNKFSVTMDIPNNKVANPYKEIVVEIVYQGTIVQNWATVDFSAFYSPVQSNVADLGNGWLKRTDLYHIEPNPNWERLCYGFNPAVTGAPAAVDSIAVSTICIPEPMTMSLLGLGLVALRKKR